MPDTKSWEEQVNELQDSDTERRSGKGLIGTPAPGITPQATPRARLPLHSQARDSKGPSPPRS